MTIKLTQEDFNYINAILLNNENGTDKEMINLFIEELNISKALSFKIVGFRDEALINLNFDIREVLK